MNLLGKDASYENGFGGSESSSTCQSCLKTVALLNPSLPEIIPNHYTFLFGDCSIILEEYR
jgi:hypothetical protein